jgi:hypothetical protein
MFQFLFAANLLVSTLGAYHVAHRVSCTKKRVCNGNLMCADVCEKGSVEVDPWIKNSLTYQRQLQMPDKFIYFQMPGTHNSAINEADGYGIEKYFISALLDGRSMDEGDDLGEGVCQYLSILDQLRIGVRHIEVDIWWDALVKETVVCHTPVPVPPIVKRINDHAKAANLTLEWDPKKMSCMGTKRLFPDVLKEIASWMNEPENANEFVIIYYDTKFYLTPDHVAQANSEMNEIFGNRIWKVKDGNILDYTLDEIINKKGKRILFENQKDCWGTSSKPRDDQVVFYPVLWTHQYSAGGFQEFPNCTIENDADWYGKEFVRAFDQDLSTEAAVRCGSTVVSPDYINPDDLKSWVWSWDYGEPKSADGCTAMSPSGRWMTLPCDTALPYACIAPEENTHGVNWSVDLNVMGAWKDATCASSNLAFAAPHNGFANNKLLVAAFGQTVWLNAPNPLASK